MLSDPEKETFKTFSNPFIEALKKVFSSMVFAEITPQSPLLNKNIEKNDISVAMGLNGVVKLAGEEKPFKGMLVLSFSTPVYLKISSSMLMNEYKEYSEEIRDVGAEITNIVTGNAKRYLREMGYLIEMSIPSTIIGSNHHIQYPLNTQVVTIPFDSTLGNFSMILCYADITK